MGIVLHGGESVHLTRRGKRCYFYDNQDQRFLRTTKTDLQRPVAFGPYNEKDVTYG